jgi:CHAP domain.
MQAKGEGRPKKRWLWAGLVLVLLAAAGYYVVTRCNINPQRQVGEVVDELDGAAVYYNGGVAHVEGRHLASDGYNLGLKYQCVEFVKRYYYEHYGHKMPDSYGHAKDFFDSRVKDGEMNAARGLIQYVNGSLMPPQKGDLVVYAPHAGNHYGHVAVVSEVSEAGVEIIQQNPGPFGVSREVYTLTQDAHGHWHIGHDRVMGFLRMP